MSESNIRIGANGRRVRTIPATLQRFATEHMQRTQTLRVAAYARVSTDDEEQQTSYEAQVDYYTKKIKENPDWIFVEVYADEGITGTNTRKREGFNRMIEDALAGKIDKIITKSVSRFARNTVDTLTTIRMLKEKGIGVTFEKENIDTLDSKGELLITIMSSLAQEESRSISENVTWGWRKRIADGKVSVAYSHFLGYKKGEGKDGGLEIVEEQAKIVREMYAMCLDGKTPSSIADILTKRGVPTPAGKQKWRSSTVLSILTNEKYKGDALLQKTFTPDFLSKKAVKNCGEVPQIYVENSHPAIVTSEVFDLVQHRLEEQKKNKLPGQKRGYTSTASIFSGKLVCGECGAYYGSKVWHSNDPYRCTIWRCNRKYEKGADRCHTPHIREEEIKAAFQKALAQMLMRKNEIIAAYEAIIASLTDTEKLNMEAARLENKLDGLSMEMNALVRRNAETKLDQEEYNRDFDALAARCEAVKERLGKINDQLAEKAGRKLKLDAFMEKLKAAETLSDFDAHLFVGTVDHVVVRGKKGKKVFDFCFLDGTKITIESECPDHITGKRNTA